MDWLEIRDVGWDGQKVDPTVGRPPLLWRSVGTLNTMLRRVSQRAGLPHLTPHMFRRAGVTAVVTHHGGNQRKTMGFSRHKSAKMVDRYDKANREELIREAQRELGEDFDK